MESAKEKIVAMIHEINNKVRELVSYVSSLAFDKVDGTIFDKVDGTAEKTAGSKDGKRVRTRINDGSMTALMLSKRCSKIGGYDVPVDTIVEIGKHCGAKPVYSQRQHASRYSAEDADRIMKLFKLLNNL